jgi:hypothetical protein
MKYAYSIVFYLTVMSLSSFAQTENRKLTIFSITEFSDGYVIKAIDTLKADTLNIISEKDVPEQKEGYLKTIIGRKYSFEIEDMSKHLAAMPPDNFVIRIKTTVVWRSGDRVKEMPVFARNTKGLFIRIE